MCNRSLVCACAFDMKNFMFANNLAPWSFVLVIHDAAKFILIPARHQRPCSCLSVVVRVVGRVHTSLATFPRSGRVLTLVRPATIMLDAHSKRYLELLPMKQPATVLLDAHSKRYLELLPMKRPATIMLDAHSKRYLELLPMKRPATIMLDAHSKRYLELLPMKRSPLLLGL
ncbi:hypothetical protein RRG08_043960 [Elysia crispata]|uniref:Uncharacterized protein n=1 Tax=Elysia crispata TaxID=231223 RepID=A0AAE1CQB4_9GAST|nr:hypothetical protein RRG08_043960 [Elysia crispata]